eukprot:s4126_g4.t1
MVFRKPNAASASVGEGAELWADAIREFRTTRADLKQAGSWDQVSHYYCLRWGIDPAGANVEGNKRDRVLGDYMDRHDIETNMDEELSSPSVAPSVAGEKDVNGLPCYPEGIYTLEAWGNTLIEFGKLKGRGWSYHQLSQDGSKDSEGYRKWLMAHAQSSQGQCRDLGRYFVRMSRHNMLPANPCHIPGTTSELWGVPFNYKEAGEGEAVSFLRKWSAKVEVFGEPDAWMVQLAKRGPTAAKSAPAEAPAKAAPPEAPGAAADAAGATTASPQDGQAAASPRVANAAAAASDPVLAQRLTDLEQKANGALEVMRSLLKQQEALVAELHKLKS